MRLVCKITLAATEVFCSDLFFSITNPTVKFRFLAPGLGKLVWVGMVPAEKERHLRVERLVRDLTKKEFLVASCRKTTPADLKQLLDQQPNGKSGALAINDNNFNWFFIGDYLVRMGCSNSAWHLSFGSVSDFEKLEAGDRIFSHD